MADDKIGVAVIGSHSKGRDAVLARALRELNLAIRMLGSQHNLNQGEAIALLLSIVAAMPQNRESRDCVAEVMERWAVMLRGDDEVHMTAAGNA